jgi:CDP-paratose 2-epimerase
MKILISGICGFVGSSLATFLRSAMAGVEISGFDNFIRPGSERNRLLLRERGIKVVHADLRSASDLESLPRADFVIDAAANPSVLAGVDGHAGSRQVGEHNLLGTLNLLEYCRRHRAGLVLLSSSRVYSIPALAALPLREADDAFGLDPAAALPAGVTVRGIGEGFSTAAPRSLYGATKLASEVMALEYGAAFGFPVWVNRCGVLAGAGQFGRAEQGIFSYWLHAWQADRPLRYIGFGGQGRQVRDALHPRDLARLIVLQLEGVAPREGRAFNVAGGMANAMSLRQLSAWCEARWGARKVEPQLESRPFDLPWIVLDAAAAEAAWPWRPEIGLPAILEEIAEHAEAHPGWLDLCAP